MNEQHPIASPEGSSAGQQVRMWRQRRRMSQMDLALDAGISTRHLSFVETGRAKPSSALLLNLAELLGVPYREQNSMLLAAGYAPRFAQHSLQAPELQHVNEALTRLLGAHLPYPGLVLDRHWNVVQANAAAMALVDLLPDFLTTPTLNIYRASLHPNGLARFTRNLDQWAFHLLGNLRRAINHSGDPMLVALEAEVLAYPNITESLRRTPNAHNHELLLPCVLDLPGGKSVALYHLDQFWDSTGCDPAGTVCGAVLSRRYTQR